MTSESGEKHIQLQFEENSKHSGSTQVVEGYANIPVKFRTLSINVTESIKVPNDSKKEMDDSEYFAAMDFHKLSTHELNLRFNTSDTVGLDSAASDTRLKRNGENMLIQRKPNYVLKVLGYVFGGFCSVLWIGVITFFLCWMPLSTPPIAPGGSPSVVNLALAILVIIVIFFQASFSAFQDWSTSRVMKSILNLLPSECFVLRDGDVKKMPASKLVVGDVVQIKLGNKVPADLRLIQVSNDLKFDRAVLTGESEAIEGSTACTDPNILESKNVALMGTHVVNGNGVGIVILTGNNTVMGRINKLTTSAKEKVTLIQKEISRFVRIIVMLTITLVLILLIEWLAFLHPKHPDFQNVVALLMNLMGCVVAFIPEGMPVGVAMTMMMIARRMKQSNILPKALTTVETLGCVTVICSDKTGTLTQNKMFVTSVGFADSECIPNDCTNALNNAPTTTTSQAYKQLHLASYLCNNAAFDSTTMDQPIQERLVNGDATDSAILRFAAELGDAEKELSQFSRTFEIPFNSKNKWMLTMYQADDNTTAMESIYGHGDDNATNNQSLIFVKGAPDIILPKCTTVLSAKTNTVVPLTGETLNILNALQEKWANNGQRVLVLCRRFYTPTSSLNSNALQDEIVNHAVQDLTVIGLVGIMDPPRAEIKQTVADCRRSGSRFFMITGDFNLTAAAIAREIGIFSSTRSPDTYIDIVNPEKHFGPCGEGDMTSLLLTGSDLQKFGDIEWENVCTYDEIVFARTTPEQKLKIVKELQKRDNIVAVTGDGVNDAPALKAADVGVAVVSGSDVAIEAADLVLMGEFDSITEAIRLGRLVFQNLQKVIGYLLPAGSWSEIWPVLVNALAGTPLPLSSFLMIMICCFTDLFPCLALIMEQEEFDLLSMKPRNPKTDHLINIKIYLQSYIFMGSMQTICSLSMFFFYIKSATGLGWYDFVGTYSSGPWGPPENPTWGTDPATGTPLTSDQFTQILYTGQCVTFVTLVILQWGNVLSIRNRKMSIFQADPIRPKRRNLWIFGGMLCALIVAIIATEVPWIQQTLLTNSVPIKHWLIPIPLAVGILAMDEIRKLLVRTFPNSIIAKLAW
ncbi:Na/K ATPase alpha 1 subunit [Mucor ambiguus]|uniref:Na/K ATPase alpha 1 subunit n=1 Tax=Mucor ambiguus TaxID=91626 RepID=A0A0C9N2T3_9FUNG|nr:Na/K ATPase alpha 1 subunit [Mucor ambiguus]